MRRFIIKGPNKDIKGEVNISGAKNCCLPLMAASISMAHLVPWTRLGLSTFTTAPARLMGLKWDGCITTGCPADLVVCEATSWVDLLSKPPKRNVLLKGSWLEKEKLN